MFYCSLTLSQYVSIPTYELMKYTLEKVIGGINLSAIVSVFSRYLCFKGLFTRYKLAAIVNLFSCNNKCWVK